MKQYSQPVRMLILLTLTVTSLTFTIPLAKAESSPGIVERIRRVFFPPKGKDRSAPNVGRTRGGASRGRCPYIREELIALVPNRPDTGLGFVEQTVSEYPTFRFYVPYEPRRGLETEFELIDTNEDTIYKAIVVLEGTPGIVSVKLPQTKPPLQTGEKYRWVFSVQCNQENRSGDVTVNGWIKRISTSDKLDDALAKMPEQEQYLVYGENLLWYDMMDKLTNLRQRYPNDEEIQQTWEGILSDIVGLDDQAIAESSDSY